jgi:limonene-1,2-epoxide hydrolase
VATDPTTETDLTAETAVVTEFLGALERLDVDAALELLDPDVEYQNVPLPPARGIDQVAGQLRLLDRYCSAFEARTHHIAANGPVVLTERTDVIGIGRLRAEFWVCGTFEVHDGRITVWRDRFDFVDVTRGFVTGSIRALLRRP